MLNKNNISSDDLFDLFKYKLDCFLNTRNKKKSWKNFSYGKWGEGDFFLSLIVGDQKIDLIRWFDSLPDIEEKKVFLFKSGYTDNDFECVKTFLSRFGYLFRVDRKCSDKDYRLLFFVIQLVNLKNAKSLDVVHTGLMTSLCQQMLFELFMAYEDFSRFSVGDDGVVFETENIGPVNLLDMLGMFFLHKKTEASSGLLALYSAMIKFLFLKENKNYKLNFNDKNEIFIYPETFIKCAGSPADKIKLFNKIKDILNPLQSTNEIFISNILLMNYIFYILKDGAQRLFEIKDFLKSENVFMSFLEAIIKRRLIVGKQHFEGLGLDDYLSRIKLNNTQFYNILSER